MYKGVYIFATIHYGVGGHMFSLETLVGSLKDKVDFEIVNIGIAPCPIFRHMKNYSFIYCNGLNFFYVLNKFDKIIRNATPDYIHVFDDKVIVFAKIISIIRKIPLVLSKCGGPNLKSYPHSDNLIFFSDENYQYYSAKKKFRRSNLFLIPNRVKSFSDNHDLIDKISKEINHRVSFLRISRISHYYEDSLWQCINLINELDKRRYDVVLVIIGVVQSKELFIKLRKTASSKILFKSEPEYFQNAKSLIGAFDFVIGTGRGWMEAASKGKVLLTPVKNSKYPVVVDSQNFQDLSKTNFSERNISILSDSEKMQKVEEYLLSDKKKIAYEVFIKNIFEKHFNIEAVIDKYLSIYRVLKKTSLRLDIVRSFFFTIKEFYIFSIRNEGK